MLCTCPVGHAGTAVAPVRIGRLYPCTHCSSCVVAHGGRELMSTVQSDAVLPLHAARFYACWQSWEACRSPVRGAMCCCAIDRLVCFKRALRVVESQPGIASFAGNHTCNMCSAACHRQEAIEEAGTPTESGLGHRESEVPRGTTDRGWDIKLLFSAYISSTCCPLLP